ncbi:hypothetical protein L1N85_20590 [Paenibacillus alkaliterrae]|uniref:ABC transporter permease subunit n=1 Tax=Paenibacillus alkaliterrae TaxID=320909 RepID=UPI001F289D0A|nr:hypothetical protein [Paenibacillus alkaliterrae]MCF2940793.1 hypothetical protein [Paenibacillus alkaliterrae]
MDLIVTVSEMFITMLVFSTVLIFAALGGLISEKSGVINIGLEGLMIAGAFSSAVAVLFAEDANLGGMSPWLGLLTGLLLFLALGTTVFLVKLIYGAGETRTLKEVFTKIHVPILSDIPVLGKALFVAYPTTYIALFLVAAMFFGIAQTLKNQIQLFPFADQIPTEFIFMFPNVLIILVLIGVVGRANPPSALGEAYYPGKR